MSDAPVGPFTPPALLLTAPTSAVAAAVWKGYYVVLGGRAVRVEKVVKADRCAGEGEGVSYQVLVVGRRVGGGERVEGWFGVGEGVQVGRLGVDAGAWEWC